MATEQHDLIYDTLCRVLAGQLPPSAWPAFSLSDWDRLVAIAQAESVAPLLYHALGEAGWPEQMPSRVRRELQSAYYGTAAHNLLLYQALSRILDAFLDATSSPFGVVLLKGATLATTVYPDQALRPLADLDLLIHRRHLDQALEVLRSLGYRDAYPQTIPQLYRETAYHVHLRGGPQQAVNVELHWNLIAGETDWRSPSLDWFWQQTEPWRMEGGKRKTENGEDVSTDVDSPASTVHSPFSILHSPTDAYSSSTLHRGPSHAATRRRSREIDLVLRPPSAN